MIINIYQLNDDHGHGEHLVVLLKVVMIRLLCNSGWVIQMICTIVRYTSSLGNSTHIRTPGGVRGGIPILYTPARMETMARDPKPHQSDKVCMGTKHTLVIGIIQYGLVPGEDKSSSFQPKPSIHPLLINVR